MTAIECSQMGCTDYSPHVHVGIHLDPIDEGPRLAECGIPGCDAAEGLPARPAPGSTVRATRMRAQGRRTPANEDHPRAFMLVRYTDVSGVSGEGVVAYGVQWRSGKVSLEWCVPGLPSSVATWDCIADVLVIHGHGNNTVVKWLDEQVELRNSAGEVCVRG